MSSRSIDRIGNQNSYSGGAVPALPVKIKGIRPVSLWTYRPTTENYAHLTELGLLSSMELVTAA